MPTDNRVKKAFLILLLSAGALHADPARDSPGNFFDRDFVIKPDTFQDGKVKQPETAVAQPSIAPDAGNKQPDFGFKTSRPDDQKTGEGNQERSITGQEKVKTISVIVNGFDQEHLKKTLDELFAVCDSRHLSIGIVYSVGGSPPQDRFLYMKTLIYNGKNEFSNLVPEKYPVKLSPAWIIETEAGQYLLEAAGKLDSFITPDGHFIDRPAAVPAGQEEVVGGVSFH